METRSTGVREEDLGWRWEVQGNDDDEQKATWKRRADESWVEHWMAEEADATAH